LTDQTIENDIELQAAFLRLEAIFQAAPDTLEGEERDRVVVAIECYERKYYPIPTAGS
jgi:HTH-type transcriptional regulator/antitoxin HigA